MSSLDLDWTQALAKMAEVNRFAQQGSEYVQATVPYPGADESALAAAEQRLGLHLDPQYRQFLNHADGWPRWDGYQSLLGTQEMVTDKIIFDGSRATWSTIFEGLHIFLEDGGEKAWDQPHPPIEHLIPIEATQDVFYTAAIVGSPRAAAAPGPVFAFSSGGIERWQSFAHYMEHQINHWQEVIRQSSRR